MSPYNKHMLTRKKKNDILYVAIRIIFGFTSCMPRFIGLPIFGFLGILFYYLPTPEKKRTIANITRIYGNSWSNTKIRKTARLVYINFGKNLFDAIYLSKCTDKRFFEIVTIDNLDAMKISYNDERGVVAITCHLGCYEMTGHAMARSGLNSFTIGQKLYDSRVDKLIVSIRQQNNLRYLHRKNSSRAILRYLKNGYLFGVLGDYSTNLDGVFANFLGIPTYTASGPMRIVMRSNIPLYIGYSYRQKNDHHILKLIGPIKLDDTGDFNRDMVINIQKVNDFITKAIREHPDQWLWMLRKWDAKKRCKENDDGTLHIRDYSSI